MKTIIQHLFTFTIIFIIVSSVSKLRDCYTNLTPFHYSIHWDPIKTTITNSSVTIVVAAINSTDTITTVTIIVLDSITNIIATSFTNSSIVLILINTITIVVIVITMDAS
jgi:hypothetical protein